MPDTPIMTLKFGDHNHQSPGDWVFTFRRYHEKYDILDRGDTITLVNLEGKEEKTATVVFTQELIFVQVPDIWLEKCHAGPLTYLELRTILESHYDSFSEYENIIAICYTLNK